MEPLSQRGSGLQSWPLPERRDLADAQLIHLEFFERPETMAGEIERHHFDIRVGIGERCPDHEVFQPLDAGQRAAPGE
ncbi:MAG: hypothetical protein E5X01_30670 [Mesorhizobium sp.]|nr:MAG: hypothetical protein E5X01_30670 [Mesorhizobium sp.]